MSFIQKPLSFADIKKTKKTLNIANLYPIQEKAIKTLMGGQSLLVVMPTGWGKSLCYQIPAILSPSFALIVSPLIALMEDQVLALEKKGIRATAIHSNLYKQERQKRYEKLKAGDYCLVYVAPERFGKTEFMEILQKTPPAFMAVDEAHCISQWGHDFRPDYSLLGKVRKKLNNLPVIALTATAAKEVKKDILKQLWLNRSSLVLEDIPYRKNLSLSVSEPFGLENKLKEALKLLQSKQKEPALFYFSLIDTLEKGAAFLKQNKIPFVKYHGKMTSKARTENQRAFLEDKNPLMLATPAFGLGIDKRNIRWIFHFEIPASLESYFQEVGRGGRDGNPYFSRLFYSEEDLLIPMEFIKWNHPEPDFIAGVYSILENHLSAVQSEGLEFIREKMNFYNRRDFRVETALNLLELWGCLKWSDKNPSKIRLLGPPHKEWLYLSGGKERRERALKKLLKMTEYVKTSSCRKQVILSYFSWPDTAPCGLCDNCRTAHLKPYST